jgi:hypothetical protein
MLLRYSSFSTPPFLSNFTWSDCDSPLSLFSFCPPFLGSPFTSSANCAVARSQHKTREKESVERSKDRRCHQLHLQYCMEEIWQGTWRIDWSRVSNPCFESSSRKIPGQYVFLRHCLHYLHFSYTQHCVQFGHIALALPLLSFLFFLTLHTFMFQIYRQTARQTGISNNSRADCAACCSWQRAVHRSDCSRHGCVQKAQD